MVVLEEKERSHPDSKEPFCFSSPPIKARHQVPPSGSAGGKFQVGFEVGPRSWLPGPPPPPPFHPTMRETGQKRTESGAPPPEVWTRSRDRSQLSPPPWKRHLSCQLLSSAAMRGDLRGWGEVEQRGQISGFCPQSRFLRQVCGREGSKGPRQAMR